MSGLSWEKMCEELVVAGRPGDLRTAALGWEQLIGNLREVEESLDRNIGDLGKHWKGPAYESFKVHLEQIVADLGKTIKDAEERDGVVQSLRAAADDLSAAQEAFPVPAACWNDVLEARNGKARISLAGVFEAKINADFLGVFELHAKAADMVNDWIFDKTEDAEKVFNAARGDYLIRDRGMPGDTVVGTAVDTGYTTPELGSGPKISAPGAGPGLGASGAGPQVEGAKMPGTVTPFGESPSGGYKNPGIGHLGEPPAPGTTPGGGYTPPKDDYDYGTGLAGATPGLGGGLGAGGGLGGGGLGGGAGLGGGGLGSGGGGLGGGAAAGMIAGGGSLGKPVTPAMGMMGGGAGAGAGRGAGGARSGVKGAGAGLGAGAGGMIGGAGGAGTKGAGARGAGAAAMGAGAGARGVGGGRGAGMVGGMGPSAGYGGADEVADRSSWLEEDEDVWGAEGEAPPGVLR